MSVQYGISIRINRTMWEASTRRRDQMKHDMWGQLSDRGDYSQAYIQSLRYDTAEKAEEAAGRIERETGVMMAVEKV